MVQFRKQYLIVAYVVALLMVYVFAGNSQVSAMEKPVEVKSANEIVYTIEKNDINSLEQVKKAILKNDTKYVLEPKALKEDLSNSEIILNSVDLDSDEIQRVQATVVRYIGGEEKTVIDQVEGEALIRFTDTVAPELKLKNKKITVEYGDKLDLESEIKEVKDNVDGEVPVEIKHDIDTKETGEYEVEFIARDKAGNETKEVLTVIVEEKPKEEKPEKERTEEVSPSQASPTPARSSTPQVATKPKPVSYQPVVNQGSIGNMLNLMNAERAKRGIAPLSLASGAHNAAASVRAQEIGSYFSHTRPNGTSYHTAFTEQGVSAGSGIEIIAAHYSGGPQTIVNMWLNSPVHARNMLSPSFSVVAIGNSGGSWAAILM